MKNPIFIPKSFEEIKNGRKTVYKSLKIKNKNIRIIEYYNEINKLERINIWGFCGNLKERKDYFVAFDKKIDFRTGQKLKKYLKKKYQKNIEMMFF